MFDRSHVDDILPNRLEEYMKEFEQDMKLNDGNIHEKTLLRSSIAAKWCRFGYEEERYKKKILESLDELKEKISQKLYEKKKTEIINQTIKDNAIKIEVEKLIKTTSQYQKISEDLKMQDEIIRFIMEAKQIISQFGFDLKNAIEILKLENI
jgi:anion-transporting  ArsA/GET3 family ATPase